MIALAFAAILQATSFDLVCTGEATARGLQTGTAAYATRYRVNLANNTWCSDSCTRASTIASVSAAEIVFLDQNLGGVIELHKFNRTSGAHTALIAGGGVRVNSAGQCTRAAFSGMPERRL